MTIKGILVTLLAPMENHIANGGEKLLGNASSIKRRPDGKVYISGQMQRHVLFSAIDRLNQDDTNKGETFVSNGDGISNKIEVDIRADLGGFMHPSKGDYSGRRTAPLSVTPAVAITESEVGRDLMLRLSTMDRDNAIATREYSESDIMHMNFFLDVNTLGISKVFNYQDTFHIGTSYIKHIKDDERKRRAKLFLEATRTMNDYANQARNAVSGEPQKVLIVFDTKMSRKASRYFVASENEKANILAELKEREAIHFIGDDANAGDENNLSVNEAYKKAFAYLSTNNLYNAAGNDESVKTFAAAFGED
ncbi:MAG: type I-PGING CRISPR-associated protein Cas7/Csp1 [Hydrotalea flava]|uniref:type I-PGING CRISPR-associated protein Cas7/Csp1 n=1 Tax=Hydrotalea lipotrueae TaxID=2803817 RepID=UPI001C48480A|nr:type I-PGING CRISPR-associated protein Cas7/Csp1 [Hydrotalea lipotrueae]MBY0347384.1 type I-PGING CRISPR-associated protein Cas7/Csp1 [Hydrotalea flava]